MPIHGLDSGFALRPALSALSPTRAWLHKRHSRAAFALVLAIGLAMTATASAQQIEAIASGNGQCFAFSDFGQDSFIATENVVSQMCDASASISSQQRFGRSISSVRVLFVAAPFADVQTFAESMNGVGSQVRSAGEAELTYLSSTRFVDGVAPPFIPGELPLRLSARWAMTTFGSDGSSASIRLTILDSDGAVFFSDTQMVNSGSLEDEYVLFGAPEPLDPFTITIASSCASIAPENGLSRCQAVIDPVLEFDQPTFDATWGAASYPLGDFWEIEQSPNLVPEPGFGHLLGVGLMPLAAVARRRRRSG